jgi:hypothetical protein
MIERVRIVDDEYGVVTVRGSDAGYCSRPCSECPWRRENVGSFPAQAFRLSAHTAEEGSFAQFACHMAPVEAARICAGFALRCHHNFALRFAGMAGRVGEVEDLGQALFDSYREMAVANGVDPQDPALERCR